METYFRTTSNSQSSLRQDFFKPCEGRGNDELTLPGTAEPVGLRRGGGGGGGHVSTILRF